jgi:hypothetical protein
MIIIIIIKIEIITIDDIKEEILEKILLNKKFLIIG